MFTEISIVVALILVNGLLAMSEMAVVSSRPARLKVLRDDGVRGAATAMRLGESPGRFLSTVQIGITLVGVLSGAFSGATLGQRAGGLLAAAGVPGGVAYALGVGVVVMLITYLSLVVGELVPKQIALRDPERVASRVAPAMLFLSRAGAPLVWLLDASGRLLLYLVGQTGTTAETVTEEEVRTVIAEAESAGVLESEERDMIAGVMRFADRSVRGLMTPRREVELIDLSDNDETIRAQIRASRRTRLPVQDGDADNIVGVIMVKDLFDQLLDTGACQVRGLVQIAPVVSDTARALDVLEALRGSSVHMALVFDEYGHFEGIVTTGDVLSAITGSYVEEGDDEPAIVERADGSFLVSGWMPVDEFADRIGLRLAQDVDYETVAGLILDELKHLPAVGEAFDLGQWRFEVIDLDGRRIDKVMVSRTEPLAASA